MNQPWSIQLFGALRARQEERLITRFRSQQTGALLAYLAYHRHQSHTRETLIELFWTASEPETGRHNLSNALSSLRSQLEPPGTPAGTVIIADRFSVELNPEAVHTDVADFEQALRRAAQSRTAPNYALLLTEAVERYTGPLLPHYYEDWIAPEQARLQQRFFQIVRQLINLLEKGGEFERALDTAQRSLAMDPLREEIHQDVMRLLMAVGRPEASIRQFHELERLLEQELGETPSVATQQLARRIESRSASALAAPLTLSVTSPPSTRSPISSPALPTGTVTFLLTDIEGSTALWEKTGDAFRSALAIHHTLLRSEFRRHGGQEVKEAGDSFFVVFAGVSDALRCAIACQRALMVQSWPEAISSLKVRMALNTGDVELEAGEYHGLMLHRAARILSTGHGGQILCSEATAGLLKRDLEPQIRLKDLGVWRLRDVEEPERLFQADYPGMATQEFASLNASPAHQTHLPLQFTRFFGREAEIARIVELLALPKTRLLTLTGPGGTGKTRLCIEGAGRFAETFPGAVWFVPLADLSDPGLIPETILQAMSIPQTGSLPPLEQMVTALLKQPTLLLLDNFEQLVAGGAEIVQGLLSRVPTLQCMATSRQTLNLPGEVEVAVAPLPTPNGSDTPERLSLFESVRLFVDRAQAAKPDFRITGSNAPAVAELCDRLEGMPLAIELAAARALVLTPAQMMVQLGNRFEFLISRKRGIVERQRTMRATVDWSYRLLPLDLQRLFAQLGVFRGGWTLAAAEAICDVGEPGPGMALDLLSQLRECSLISTEESGHGIRFRMLESLREYAQEQLSVEEDGAVRARHRDYFRKLAENSKPQLMGSEQNFWLDALEAEHDNLRQALTYCLERSADGELGLQMGAALWRFWHMRGPLSEGRERLMALLAQPGAQRPTRERAEALNGAGNLAWIQGDFASARSLHEAGLAIQRERENRQGIANSLNNLGLVAERQGDYTLARSLMEESLTIAREIGNLQGIAIALNNLGNVADRQGDYAAAYALYEESLAIERQLENNQGVAYSLNNMGLVAWARGDYVSARSLHEASLALQRAAGNRQGISLSLNNLGLVAERQGDYVSARSLYEASLEGEQESENKNGIACVLNNLGNIAKVQGDYVSARSLYEESLMLAQEVENKQYIVTALNNLGSVAVEQGDYAAAYSLAQESLAAAQDLGDRVGIAHALNTQGLVAERQGDYVASHTLLKESLAVRMELGDRNGIAECLDTFAELARREQQERRATQLWGATTALREVIRVPRSPRDQERFDREVAETRSVLGDVVFDAAFAEGSAMTTEKAIAYALNRSDVSPLGWLGPG